MDRLSASFRPLAIGVTGHRLNQIEPHLRESLSQRIGDTLDRIAACAGRAAAPKPVRLRLVSALAEGVDRFAAREALARAWPLIAPLPFPRDRYLEDFQEPGSKAEFHALAARAVSVVEPVDAQGYLAVGLAIIDASDVLLAVWNGLAPRGPGGTADVAARMLRDGRPVIWLHTEGEGRTELIKSSKRPRAGSFRARLEASLAQAFSPVPQPDSMRLADA